MDSYNKIISDYIIVDDTPIKNTIIALYIDSECESLPNFMDIILEKCGINSINMMLINGRKWDAYMSFTRGNIFSEEKGILELVKKQDSKLHTEETLANKLIELLDTVDFLTFINRVNPIAINN